MLKHLQIFTSFRIVLIKYCLLITICFLLKVKHNYCVKIYLSDLSVLASESPISLSFIVFYTCILSTEAKFTSSKSVAIVCSR